LFAFLTVPLILPFGLILVFKVFGANLMRLYIKWEKSREAKKEAA